jgi:hypothetical protein
MKSAYFTLHPGKNLSFSKWLQVEIRCSFVFVFFYRKSTGFASSTFPIQLDFSKNQLAAITLNTGSPRALAPSTRNGYGLLEPQSNMPNSTSLPMQRTT